MPPALRADFINELLSLGHQGGLGALMIFEQRGGHNELGSATV